MHHHGEMKVGGHEPGHTDRTGVEMGATGFEPVTTAV